MDDRVKGIAGRCKQVLQDHYGSRFAGLVVFGSSARGEAGPQSDVDLLVLLEGGMDYFGELRALAELLYPVQLECQHLLSAKPATVDEYESGRLQLYRSAKREGVRI